jgi:hypothetical protein
VECAARVFMKEMLGAAAATLIPVIATAFLAIPYTLGAAPGADRSNVAAMDGHLS